MDRFDRALIVDFVLPLFVVVLLLVNYVFASNRVFGVVSLRPGKSLLVRLVELSCIYAALLMVFRLVEERLHGDVYRQGWEFYALTICFFLVMAFPGFVYRYMWKKAI